MQFTFGSGAAAISHTGEARVALPHRRLAGAGPLVWARDLTPEKAVGGFQRWSAGGELWGAAVVDVARGQTEAATRTLYAGLLRAAHGHHLHRIWNYIPGINADDAGLERYRAFCLGRQQALKTRFGDAVEALPAASALGTDGPRMVVVFVAGSEPAVTVENPLQTPAYRYPPAYGPQPPSFARAALACRGRTRQLWISGTAAIRDSRSLYPGDAARQLPVLLDNLDAVARAAGLADGLSAAGQRGFIVYVRQAPDWQMLEPLLARRLLRPGDRWVAVQADVCRAELMVEIEACLAQAIEKPLDRTAR